MSGPAKRDPAQEQADYVTGQFARVLGVGKDDPMVMRQIQRVIDKGYNPRDWADFFARGGTGEKPALADRAQGGSYVKRLDLTGPMPEEKPSAELKPSGIHFRESVAKERTLPPTRDEELGIDNPVTADRARATLASLHEPLTNPSTRRGILRGIDKNITFGAGTRLGRLIDEGGNAVENASRAVLGQAPVAAGGLSEAQHAIDQQESPNAETGGELVSLLSPEGAFARTAQLANRGTKAVTGIVKPGASVLGNMVHGAVTGGVAAPVAVGAAEAGRSIIEGNPGDALDRAKAAASNPLVVGAGATFGGIGGGAASLAKGHSQLAQDLQLIGKYGAKPSILQGAKGGVLDAPIFEGVGSDSKALGRVSDRAATAMRGELNRRFTTAGDEYQAARRAAGDAGALDAQLDITPLYQEAQKMLQSRRLTADAKAKIQREVIDDLESLADRDGVIRMGVKDFNDFKGKLADLADFETPNGIVRDPNFAALRSRAQELVDETEMGPINAAYSKAMDELQGMHRQLGMRGVTHTAADDTTAQRRLANFITRRGENTKTAGIDEERLAAFMTEHPELAPLIDAAKLTGARSRLKLSPGGHEQGGGLAEKVVGHANLPSLLGTVVYPMGTAIGGAAPQAGQAAQTAANMLNMIQQARAAELMKNAERAKKTQGAAP